MKVPTFIRDKVIGVGGFFSDNFQQFFDVLIQQMQEKLSDNGFVNPSLTTSEIEEIAGDMDNGTVWYDTDAHALKVKINGEIKTVQVI